MQNAVANPKAPGDLAIREPLAAQPYRAGHRHEGPGPTNPLAFAPSPFEPRLHPLADAQVLLLGDVPDMAGNPVTCLRQHRRDMSACTPPRVPQAQRRTESATRLAARAGGASFRTLYGKICTYDPCPLVQGDVLMWRDGGHLTSTFVHHLTPALRSLLSSAMAAKPARLGSALDALTGDEHARD